MFRFRISRFFEAFLFVAISIKMWESFTTPYFYYHYMTVNSCGVDEKLICRSYCLLWKEVWVEGVIINTPKYEWGIILDEEGYKYNMIDAEDWCRKADSWWPIEKLNVPRRASGAIYFRRIIEWDTCYGFNEYLYKKYRDKILEKMDAKDAAKK